MCVANLKVYLSIEKKSNPPFYTGVDKMAKLSSPPSQINRILV